MQDITDITIIGAGVVGLAVAAQVASRDRQVYVLEKNKTFGQEISSRHSGIIHSGIYYPEGSLKAKLCVAGNDSLYRLCQVSGIGYRKLGKLIVATGDEEIEELEILLANRETALAEDVMRHGVTEAQTYFDQVYRG